MTDEKWENGVFFKMVDEQWAPALATLSDIAKAVSNQDMDICSAVAVAWNYGALEARIATLSICRN